VGELRLPVELSDPLIEEAGRADPEEACGLIVGRRRSRFVRAIRTVPCENCAPQEVRGTRFEIDARRLIEEEQAIPSKTDETYMALWPDKVWVIVGRRAGQTGRTVRAWSLDLADPASPKEVRLT